MDVGQAGYTALAASDAMGCTIRHLAAHQSERPSEGAALRTAEANARFHGGRDLQKARCVGADLGQNMFLYGRTALGD